MKKTELYFKRGLILLVVGYIITAPYSWWNKAKEQRDMYKDMYKATQLELNEVASTKFILLPPPIEG